MAERVGFEPTVPLLAAHTISSRAPSASSDISPHHFEHANASPKAFILMAERVGFEPTIPGKRDTAFRERGLQPLGNLSKKIQGPHAGLVQ